MDNVNQALQRQWDQFRKDNATLLLNIDNNTAKLIFVHGYSAGLASGVEVMAYLRRQEIEESHD